MNNLYDGSKMAATKGILQRPLSDPHAEIDRERNPMLPKLLNDLTHATQITAELVEQLEQQLDPIASQSLPPPESPNQKDPSCLPPALEMLRSTLTRVNAINDRLHCLMRRVEL